jgi:hypothetical protein
MVVRELVAAPAVIAGRLFVVSGSPPFDDHGIKGFLQRPGPPSTARMHDSMASSPCICAFISTVEAGHGPPKLDKGERGACVQSRMKRSRTTSWGMHRSRAYSRCIPMNFA